MNLIKEVFELCICEKMHPIQAIHTLKISISKLETIVYRIGSFSYKNELCFSKKVKENKLPTKNTKKIKELKNKKEYNFYENSILGKNETKRAILKFYIELKNIIIEMPFIIHLLKKEGMSYKKIAAIFLVDPMTVFNYKKNNNYVFSRRKDEILKYYNFFHKKKKTLNKQIN